MNFRYSQPFASMATCNAATTAGDLGVAGATVFFPGQPSKSVLSLRPHSTGVERMPPLASRVVDVAGSAVLDGWITATTTCPP